MNKKIQKLNKKITNYQNIIFDLDNTIYDIRDFEFCAFTIIYKYLNKFKVKNNIYKILKKKYSNKYYPFLIDEIIINNKLNSKLAKKCLSLYYSTKPLNLKSVPNLNNFLSKVYKKKNLYLITNGNINIQKKKVANLGIKKFFKKIIYCGKNKNKTKPNNWPLKKIKSLENKEKFLVIGDSIEDKLLAYKNNLDYYKFKFINKKYEKKK